MATSGTQGSAQSTQREVRVPAHRVTRQKWLPHITSVTVITALAIALMILVASVGILHFVVSPWFLEKVDNNNGGKPYIETNNSERGKREIHEDTKQYH